MIRILRVIGRLRPGTRWLLGIALTASMLLLSLAPSKAVPSVARFPHADKVAHFAVYAVYAAALLFLTGSRWRECRVQLLILAYCSGFGVGTELLQGAFRQLGRQACVYDAAANAAGAAFAVLAAGVISRYRPSTENPAPVPLPDRRSSVPAE